MVASAKTPGGTAVGSSESGSGGAADSGETAGSAGAAADGGLDDDFRFFVTSMTAVLEPTDNTKGFARSRSAGGYGGFYCFASMR